MSGSANSHIQEKLVKLYLRLNGYFTTGLIIHAPIHVGTEMDCIAVRFPFHDQREREIGYCPRLKIPSSGIDLVIAEVKAKGMEFNNPMKEGHANAEINWSQLLRWVGLWTEEEVQGIIEALIQSVSNPIDGRIAGYKTIEAKSQFGKVILRPILFSIDNVHKDSLSEDFINGQDILDYISVCLDPKSKRPECAVGYNLNLWGEEFESLVRLFKSSDKTSTLETIYQNLNNSTQ